MIRNPASIGLLVGAIVLAPMAADAQQSTTTTPPTTTATPKKTTTTAPARTSEGKLIPPPLGGEAGKLKKTNPEPKSIIPSDPGPSPRR